ncbi:MAG: hydroxyacylglutathione hydrolase [Chthoniobacter sp.]|jgi:glyoxylase-like metal-dependent hydrolase (beta-lactamase superfamily II)|nr:hydroxyacylglutathione hydrolase [Chthoniobacter sp.]
MPIPLEDNFSDIIGKAQRGLRISDSELAAKTGIGIEAIQRLRSDEFDAAAAGRIAATLGLNARALIEAGEKRWAPREIALSGVAMFTTPFHDMTVNAYLAWDENSKEAAAFDTGSDCDAMLDGLRQHGLTLRAIFLTHTHGDHIYDLDRLTAQTGAPAYVSHREPLDGAEKIDDHRQFEIGALRIRVRPTAGHSAGGLTYVIEGLSQPVAVVGDSLFAGSMGGGTVSYEDALRNNRAEILTLPDETIICPGHGPMTTVAEEKLHNPFFAT